MLSRESMTIKPIGKVRTTSDDTSVIELYPDHAEGLAGLSSGDRLDIIYWMHELPTASRRAVRVHPRGDKSRPKKGVFGLRSPTRPNPIGVSTVQLAEIRGNSLLVVGLDAHDGSPVLDIKGARADPGAMTP